MAIKISSAGNTEVPCYLAAKSLKYKITRKISEDRTEIWVAKSKYLEVSGESPAELLGLIYMYEIRGENWKAGDDQIELFAQDFYRSNK